MKSLATIPQTLGLADMTESELAETFTKLDAAREHYDNLSGICATLQGLVLIEVKAKVGHGKYQKWIEEHFPKSYKTANRFTRIADDFLAKSSTANTRESKSLRSETFAEQLLLTDLAESLQAIRSETLDMGHPIVKSIASYAGGRSYNQMWLDLGPAPLGGDHRRRDEKGDPVPRPRRTNDEIARDAFEMAARPACANVRRVLTDLLSLEGPPPGRMSDFVPKSSVAPRAWDVLDDKALRELKELAIDLRDGILASENRRAQLRPRAK